MSDLEQSEGTRDWAAMDIEKLVGAHKRIFQSITSQVDDLIAMTPVLQQRLKDELGLIAETDFGAVTACLQRLLDSFQPRRAGSARAARAPRGTRNKPQRFLLVDKESGEAVRDAAGRPLAFKTRIKILRGPKYEELLGKERVKQVRLVDTEEDNRVVVDNLKLGPAPGGRRR